MILYGNCALKRPKRLTSCDTLIFPYVFEKYFFGAWFWTFPSFRPFWGQCMLRFTSNQNLSFKVGIFLSRLLSLILSGNPVVYINTSWSPSSSRRGRLSPACLGILLKLSENKNIEKYKYYICCTENIKYRKCFNRK